MANGNDPASDAVRYAQMMGTPFPVQGSQGLYAFPDGSIGPFRSGWNTPQGATMATPNAPGPSVPTVPGAAATGNWPGQERSTSLGNWPDQNQGPQAWTGLLPQQPPNFNIRPASPVMAAPTATMPLGGMTPSPSGGIPYGPPVPQQFGPPVPANLAHQAARYRATHGVPAAGDADLLNAQSLAAAQQGRTAFNPQLAAVYGGGTVPGFNVTNALQAPSPSLTPQVAQNYLTALQQQTRWQPNNVNFLAGQPSYGSGLGPQY